MAGEGVEFELRIRSDFVPQKFVHRCEICPSTRRKILQHNELSWSDPISNPISMISFSMKVSETFGKVFSKIPNVFDGQDNFIY